MPRRTKKPRKRRECRVTRAESRIGPQCTGLDLEITVIDSEGRKKGHPPGSTLQDGRLVEMMHWLTVRGPEVSWLDAACRRPEFSSWSQEDREEFISSWQGRKLDVWVAAMFYHALADHDACGEVGVANRLILTGCSLMHACHRRDHEVRKALGNYKDWWRNRMLLERRKTRELYTALTEDMIRLTGMTEEGIFTRIAALEYRAFRTVGRWKKTGKSWDAPAYSRDLVLTNDAYMTDIKDEIVKDRGYQRIPDSIAHPHEVVLAFADLEPLDGCVSEDVQLPYVRCIFPGCPAVLDAGFFRRPTGQSAPPMTVCSEHEESFWKIIDSCYPGGVLDYLEGRDAEGFALEEHWHDSAIAEMRPVPVKPACCRVFPSHEPPIIVTKPELDPSTGGMWLELTEKGGFWSGATYMIPVEVGGGRLVLPLGTNSVPQAAAIIRIYPETLPLLVTSVPVFRWRTKVASS